MGDATPNAGDTLDSHVLDERIDSEIRRAAACQAFVYNGFHIELEIYMRGNVCSMCGTTARRFVTAYQCRNCSVCLCKDCASGAHETRPIHETSHRQSAGESGQDGSCSLLTALQLLLVAWPFQPVVWIARCLRQQTTAIRADLLSKATSSLSVSSPSEKDHVAQLLLRAFGNLLFRLTVGSDEQQAIRNTTQAIRDRLSLVACGDWLKIVTDCMLDLGFFEDVHSGNVPFSTNVTSSEWDGAQLGSAASKAWNGSLLAATDILIGNPRV